VIRTLCIIVAVVSVAWGAEVAPNRFEAYSTAFTDPSAAEQMIRSIVGEDGNVAVDARGQRLLVMTTDERHAQIAAMMKKLNVPPKNVRIDVHFAGGGASHEAEASVSGDGQVVYEDGVTHGTIRIKPRILNETTTTSSDVLQTLMVASGREGALRVGEEVPYVEWIMDYGYSHGILAQRVNWQRVGASLLVEPTVVGDGPTIRVRITPQLSGLVDGRPMQTRFASVATEVYVTDGQTFPIGGLDQHRDFYSRFLVGRSRSGSAETLTISLTPHIVGTSY
jgi:type II secretory pathway component GspD/PulD (secretin)